MANVYVRSGAGGAGTGADWANAYTTLSVALAAKAAGDDFWMAGDHAESTASAVTLACPGIITNPCRIICVDHTGTVPPVSADLRTTATVTTTGASSITLTGFFYCYGITFTAGSGVVTANINVANTGSNWQSYKSCNFRLGGTTAGSIVIANSVGKAEWDNCTVKFATAGNLLSVNSVFTWKNSVALDAATVLPTTRLMTTGASPAIALIEGVDFSLLTNKGIHSNSTGPYRLTFKNCKLPTGMLYQGASANRSGTEVTYVDCDSAAGVYRNEKHDYTGDQTSETTIVRTGGASDGTTAFSSKIITTANSLYSDPFVCLPIVIWNETTGSAITLTIEGIWGAGVVPLNDEIWMDVLYMGASGSTLASLVSTTKADVLAAGANNTSSSETWGGSTTKFKMAATFTPQTKGPITVYVKCAKVSTTFYIDPEPVISGVTVSRTYPVQNTVLNETSGGGGTTVLSGVIGS